MEIVYLTLIGIVIAIAGLVIFVFGIRTASVGEMDERLKRYVVEPIRTEALTPIEIDYRREELSAPVTSRIIAPIFRSLGGLLGRLIPISSSSDLEKQMTIAGNPLGMGAREFYGIRILFAVLGFFLGYQLYTRNSDLIGLLLAGFVVIIMFSLPRLWLRSVVRKKKNIVRRNLPDALDMLSVCADAGLGFDQSLQRVSEYWKNPLGYELGRVVNEMNMGLSRAQAMRSLSDRYDVSELTSFVAVILQSDQLGMSIADTLHAQAHQMRIERRFWAQEQARKIPLKMLIPLMLLILPAMFAVVLGPAIPNMMDVFGGL
ncbi:MAG: type II secretion system F family protein [Chloroflexota bacterium]|nr:type II secretion system F family protein [Chloroflexota bacterium]